MKKIIAIVLSACVVVFNNCSDDAYTDKYSDPNKITTVQIDKLMVGVFVACNDWAIMGYNRYFSIDNLYLANFTQSFGRPWSNTMYLPGWSMDGSGQYSSLFTAKGRFNKLEDLYNELSEADKPKYESYYLAAKLHLYGFLVSMLDTYGDLPFTEGGRVASTGDINTSNAHFDKAEDLYKLVIDETKTIGIRFGSISIPFGATQDFINKGDASKWQKYANSLRLRAALRVASQGALASYGRAAIKEIVENPGTYPVVETIDDNIQIANGPNGSPYYVSDNNGFGDSGGSSASASDAIVSRMLSDYSSETWSGTYQEGIDDPRIAILYQLACKTPKFSAGDPTYEDNLLKSVEIPTVFRGLDYTMSDQTYQDYTTNATGISRVRHCGFMWYNLNLNHQIISAPEIWFIKAEAYLNNWASGDAESAFKEGVKQSIKNYFLQHTTKSQPDDAVGAGGTDARGYVINPQTPDEAWLEDFAAARWKAPINDVHPYVDKLDAIITQKYLDFSVVYVREAWSDLRRTGYPSDITFPTVSNPTVPNVPVRLRYPVGERDYNKNFNEVNRPGFNADDYYTKLFWMK
ncbi:MAG: SusD/RagB family nutrient-binding outer membrane lipoprotein [Bacteroidales bacterium]